MTNNTKREEDEASVEISGIDRRKTLDILLDSYCEMYPDDSGTIIKKSTEWNNRYCKPPLDKEIIRGSVRRKLNELATDRRMSDFFKGTKPSKSQQVYDFVVASGAKLFLDQDKTPFARIDTGPKDKSVEIESREFSDIVRGMIYKEYKTTISDSIMKEAASMLRAEAISLGKTYELNHRVAQIGDKVYYNLQNTTDLIVEIDENGWRIVRGVDHPFLFMDGQGIEQVIPERGGDLRDFLKFVNIKDKDEQMLFLSTLPVRMVRNIDQAIIYFHGPAGSAKTTALKMVKNLLDPSVAPISLPIRNEDDLLVSLNKTWVFANDNISEISNRLSDLMCTMATGADRSKRKLYTDSEVSVVRIKNPAYLTGVNVEAYKSDLLSRILLFKTEIINREERRSGTEIEEEFQKAKPYLLGAIFDTLSEAMRLKKEIPQNTQFRMYDFSLWGAACAESLGYSAESFEMALRQSVLLRAYDAIYSLSVGRVLLKYLQENGFFEGTVSNLLDELKSYQSNSGHSEYIEGVANNPASLGKKLREIENSLDAIGVTVDLSKRTNTERLISLKWDSSAKM